MQINEVVSVVSKDEDVSSCDSALSSPELNLTDEAVARTPRDTKTMIICLPIALGMAIGRLFFPNYAFVKLFLSGFIPALNALIPLFYTGQIPDSSALAIASQFIFISIMLEIIQETVVNSLFHLVGRDYQENHRKSMQALKICLLILFILGALLCILVIAFTAELVNVIDTPDQIIDATKAYLFISAFSFPIILLNEAIKCHLLITTHILLVVSSLCQVLFTFLLNFFLFGTQTASAHWGVDQLGLYKILESLIGLTTNIFFFFLIEKMSPFTFLFKIPIFADIKNMLTSIVHVSWGNFGDSLIRNFFYFVVTLKFVNYLGPDEAAAWNLVNSIVWTFLLIPSYALTNQVKIVVGLYAGAPNLKAKTIKVAKDTARGLCAWSITVGIFSVTCWSWLARTFSPHNADVQELSKIMFYSVGWVFILFAVSSALGGVFYGTGRTRFIFYQSLIGNLVVYFGPWIAYLTGSLEPTVWLVLTLYAAGMVLGLLLTIAFFIRMWRNI